MIFLGIDPGLQRTGYGVIRQSGNALALVGCGVITSNAADPLPLRLKTLAEGVQDVIARFAPLEAGVEETFVNVNAQSTLKLGQARGAILLALAQANIPIHEYAANLVKKSIVGSGHAQKPQVAAMVQILLPGCGKHGPDAMDALAVAICHAHHRKMSAHLPVGSDGPADYSSMLTGSRKP